MSRRLAFLTWCKEQEGTGKKRTRASPEQRFFRHVVQGPGQCMLWRGAVAGQKRYGLFYQSREKKKVYAHRFAYEAINGPIPDGLVVRHKCHTPRCVNPEHLTIGTAADNIRDKLIAGREPRGESRAHSKLNALKIRVIRFLARDTRLSQEKIGLLFGVCDHTIRDVVLRKKWTHVQDEHGCPHHA